MVEYTELETLVRYKAWADDIFLDAIANLPDTELQRSRPMLFGNILSLLNHVYAMDRAWQCNLTGKPHNYQARNPTEQLPFPLLQQQQSAINHWYIDYTVNLSAERFKKAVTFTFIGGGEGTMRRSEIIQHIVNHASYHRGHIEGVLYHMSIEPPTTDIPVFLAANQAL